MTTLSLSISAQELAIVQAVLRRHVPGNEVWAFGSRAGGRVKAFSDLDLAILGDEPLPLSKLAEMAEEFTESALPFKVDLVDWGAVAPEFRARIAARYVVVQPPLPRPR